MCTKPVVILNQNPAGFRASAASVPSARAQVSSAWRWIACMWRSVGTKAAPMAIHVRSMPVVNLNENPRGFLTSAASLGSMWPLAGPKLTNFGRLWVTWGSLGGHLGFTWVSFECHLSVTVSGLSGSFWKRLGTVFPKTIVLSKYRSKLFVLLSLSIYLSIDLSIY